MRSSLPLLIAGAFLVVIAGCATSVDMDTMNRRIDDNAARIATLEEKQARFDQEASSTQSDKFQALQAELDALRKEFADSKWTVDDLAEKVESFGAYVKEVDQFMEQFRKKGGEMDKALENMTNRLETDVRSLSEKLKKLLEDQSQ